MFQKISSKLQSGRAGFSGGHGNGKKVHRGFPYGRMQKAPAAVAAADDAVLPSADGSAATLSTPLPSFAESLRGSRAEEPEEEKEASSDFSFAESVFPISSDSAGYGQRTPRLGPEVNHVRGDSDSGDSWFDDGSSGSQEDSGEPSLSGQEEPSCVGKEAEAVSNKEDGRNRPAGLKEYEDEEEEFLEEFEEYFENLAVDNIRKEQYPKLESEHLVYLDYATCGLFSSFQVEEHTRAVLDEVPFLRPFEDDFSGVGGHVADAQDRLFRLLNADRSTYSMIFTTSFTRGVQLVAEAFPFQKNTPLLVCQDNHGAFQSLIGCATDRGARPISAPLVGADLSLDGAELRKVLGRRTRAVGGSDGLFVFPVQSCLSGINHTLNWVAEAQQGGWQVLIDASTSLPTGKLDLSIHQPEFVLGSIAHLLGYPSGIGFLLVRKGDFGVQYVGHDKKKVKFIRASGSSDGRDAYVVDEHGILNAPSFSAVAAGLAHLETVGHEAICKRVRSLMAWLLRILSSLRHTGDSGRHLVWVHGPLTMENRRNIVTFNILDSTGSDIPSTLVRSIAEECNIFIGSECLSFPSMTTWAGKGSERGRAAGPVVQNSEQFSSLRVSLGPVTNFQDVYTFVKFISRFRDEDYLSGRIAQFYENNRSG